MYVCTMYVTNKLHFYFLFLSQYSICYGLSVFVNYPRIPSPPFPQIIDSTLYIHFAQNKLNCTRIICRRRLLLQHPKIMMPQQKCLQRT